MLLQTDIRHFVRNKFPRLTILWKKGINLCNFIFYRYMCFRYHSDKKIVGYKGYGKGKRCFMIGNGPSLNAEDLDRLIDEDCFACNHIEQIYDQTKWRPKFYTIDDPYRTFKINEQNTKNIFMSAYFLRKHRKYMKKVNCFYGTTKWKNDQLVFSSNVTRYINNYPTVVFTNIQLAVYMGYSEIYLLGVDCDFTYTFETTDKEAIKAGNKHFYDDKKMNAKYENNPADVKGINKAFYSAKQYCKAHGIKIYNATRGGKLEIFERVNFDSIFV